MGQAWCKEKSTKAQDSKSPLDRVFLRCAHRIYPGLKEEGSVLGGATQRVTSSEIGYAGSPPRQVLARGQSIDSVDRPFHPSDWVDVNLEVPVTPRTSTAMTNLTLDTTIYPPTTLNSTNFRGSNLRDFAPIPPPRRRRKNRGRPLPPKPDEAIARSHVDRVTTESSKDLRNSCHEPLYSSVKISKNSSNDKEIIEHKINGTGKIIPSIVIAASRSNRDKSSRDNEKTVDKKNLRPKNSSTVSLPNYLELGITDESLLVDDDEEIKIHKITAAESLPALITSGALESLKKSDNERKARNIVESKRPENEEKKCSFDEVDFSFDLTKNQDALSSILKLEGPRLTSTPVKNDFENDSRSPTTIGGWFLHQDRAPESDNFTTSNNAEKQESEKTLFHDCHKDSRSDIFFETEEDQMDQNNLENDTLSDVKHENVERRTRTSLKRTLSNESEPFDSCEEKELRDRDSTTTMVVRSNSQVKLHGRAISDESLPAEMLENETNFFEEKEPIVAEDKTKKYDEDKKLFVELMKKSDDTKTPPPSPEPKIKPEILDNDHSSLLKVLREEAQESNLSSMTPSLTELEAALSDMLEREDDQDTKDERSDEIVMENLAIEKILEKPIEPKIYHNDLDKDMKNSVISVSLKNILGDSEKFDNSKEKTKNDKIVDDSPIMEIDTKKLMKNDDVRGSIDNLPSNSCPIGVPPEKPSRLHHHSHEESSEQNFEQVPTPPRRRNRYSGYSSSILTDRSSLERTATPENPYPNDRLI